MRMGLRGWIRSEVENTAINIYPSVALQHVFVFMNSAIVEGQTYIRRPVLVLGIDILKPFSVHRIIFKQAQQQIQLAPGLHNTEKFAEHFVLPLKIVKRFDTDDFCEIVVERGNLFCVSTVVTHVRECAALLAR